MEYEGHVPLTVEVLFGIRFVGRNDRYKKNSKNWKFGRTNQSIFSIYFALPRGLVISKSSPHARLTSSLDFIECLYNIFFPVQTQNQLSIITHYHLLDRFDTRSFDVHQFIYFFEYDTTGVLNLDSRLK